jgi:hypothetical protein
MNSRMLQAAGRVAAAASLVGGALGIATLAATTPATSAKSPVAPAVTECNLFSWRIYGGTLIAVGAVISGAVSMRRLKRTHSPS